MHHRLYLPALAAILLLSACVKKDIEPPTPEESAANFEAFITAATRKTAAELTPEEMRQVFDQYQTMEIAANAGEKAGLARKPEVAAQLRVLPRDRRAATDRAPERQRQPVRLDL